MGILNLSPESPVKGSVVSADQAHSRAEQLLDDGADIIDVGGNSSSSRAREILVDEEITRVIPIVRRLSSAGMRVSVDTWNWKVADAAIDAGAWMINDIDGGRDPRLVSTVVEGEVRYCIMHMRGRPKGHYEVNQTYTDVVSEVVGKLKIRAEGLERQGLKPDMIYLDPGFGFGRDGQTNLELLKGLERLKGKYRLLVSASRKAFLTDLYKASRHDQYDDNLYEATIVFNTLLMLNQPDIVRVHDVRAISVTRDIVSSFLEASESEESE